MARGTANMEGDLALLWGLVGDLSDQLQNNRALVAQLKARSDNVKGQAMHVGAGFPLRRFNLDISDEEFTSELEKFSSHLVLENQQLQSENRQLNSLLKEYEQTLETVMGKFRGVAHASQQHDLSLHSYYTSLLQQLQTAHSSAQLHDNTSLSLLLTRLSALLRSTLRSMGGEEPDTEVLSQFPGLLLSDSAGAGGHARPVSGPSSPTSSSPAQSTASGKKSGASVPRPPPKSTFRGFQPQASGGYTGTDGQQDWALEREAEILRLEEENAALRELLALGQTGLEDVPAAEEEQQEEEDHEPEAPGRRKSSLTVEELEADAQKEEEALKHAQEHAGEEQDEHIPGGGLALSDVISQAVGEAGEAENVGLRAFTEVRGRSSLGMVGDGPLQDEVIED